MKASSVRRLESYTSRTAEAPHRAMSPPLAYLDALCVKRSGSAGMAVDAPPSAGRLISERLAATRSAAGLRSLSITGSRAASSRGAPRYSAYLAPSYKWSFLRFQPAEPPPVNRLARPCRLSDADPRPARCRSSLAAAMGSNGDQLRVPLSKFEVRCPTQTRESPTTGHAAAASGG
jgi:hypothetical protein